MPPNTPLFSYGTLQPGGHYWPQIAPMVAHLQPAHLTAGYLLYHLPQGYPALLPAPKHIQRIDGSLITFAPDLQQRAWQICDQIEGFVGPSHPDNLYTRANIEVIIEAGQPSDAQLYHWPMDRAHILQTRGQRLEAPNWRAWFEKTGGGS